MRALGVSEEPNSNVSCTASVQLPGRPPSPPWAVERDITKYGTMWNQAMIGWQMTPSVVSQAWLRSWLPYTVVTGTRPWRLSGDSWQRRINQRDVVFYIFRSAWNCGCLPLDLFCILSQRHCPNQHSQREFVGTCGKELYLPLFFSSHFDSVCWKEQTAMKTNKLNKTWQVMLEALWGCIQRTCTGTVLIWARS